MIRIRLLDPLIQSQLGDCKHIVELCDKFRAGVGTLYSRLFTSTKSGREPQISEKELDRRERAGVAGPLADIIVDLEKRA